ncbi:uncharacterized protein HKW66_Vig0113660 [Vigna angularis]|uniref:Uncharacterized protein n=1 Tax=Phaseolus angularis TaxID=3914 RepID=A0A8T0KXM7_PHAAN|nr:uncharacterized protein HKW66_Vig0113660 [Vigna angularis]
MVATKGHLREALEKIIERNYFPDISKLHDRLDWLEAIKIKPPPTHPGSTLVRNFTPLDEFDRKPPQMPGLILEVKEVPMTERRWLPKDDGTMEDPQTVHDFLLASDLSSISDFSVSFNICATSRSQFCIHCGQQIDTASGSTFLEARLNGEIVVVGKVFNVDKDRLILLWNNQGNKILERDHRSWSGNGGGSRRNRSGRERRAWKAGGFCGEERERGRKKETATHDSECRGGQRSGGKKP